MNKEDIKTYIKREKKLIDYEFDLIENLSKLRKEHNLSQRQLCSLIGMNQPVLAKIEKGVNSPQLNTLLKILEPLGYTIQFIKK